MIAGANVLVVETGHTGVSDEGGVYRITGLPAGTYTVKFTAAGYVDFTTSLEVLTGTVSTLDAELQVYYELAVDS